MAITPEPTPNPNAMKFTVGRSVGGPATYTPENTGDSDLAAALLEIDGVVSMFMTADFVTLTKSPDADWGEITGPAAQILEDHFG